MPVASEPVRVFDNLYFVGGKVHSAWALTTSEGIILIDTIFPYSSEELIVDIIATDGMKITLGGTTVTIWLTPGHTPGTLSYTFTMLDRGRPVNVAYSGGTAFNFVNNTPDPGIKNFQTYVESAQHMAARAAATGATVLLSNHSEFDNAQRERGAVAPGNPLDQVVVWRGCVGHVRCRLGRPQLIFSFDEERVPEADVPLDAFVVAQNCAI